ncbi:V-type ATPase subunit [Vagococcus acidifermentans]|uniref:V-type ATP synthase subunit C n=1 Tax=Vagococcus acidifermentans TaxID=564710 RepID=A0A430AQU1_9ENTE|nr:V-type ATPase subunit [Vagococcus acidifermentans]RSU10426.1 V-type ATP synthase subunit C [Vagococcus acidifermentans]
MKDSAYNQLNPLIRVREAELLSHAQFEQLLAAKDMAAVTELLRGTRYEQYAEGNLLANFNQVFKKEQEAMFQWLYQHAPDKRIIHIYSSRFTFHNLKVLTKAEINDMNLDHLLLPDGLYTKASLKSAVRTKKSNELPEFLLSAIHEVFDYLERARRRQGIDVIYDRLFLTYQRQLADDIGEPNLLEEVISFIDFNNIGILARGILRGNTPTFLSTVLSSSGSIPKKELLEYAEGSLAALTEYVLNSKYGDMFQTILDSDSQKIDVLAIDRLRDDYLTKFYEKADTTAFGPLPLLAYLNSKEIEWKNLRLILVGKVNHFSDAQIRERMRLV